MLNTVSNELSDFAIFRITHIDNLPTLLVEDGIWCGNEMKKRSIPYISIGNKDLTASRATRVVKCCEHGNLNDYVPFYFCPQSVMLYLIYRQHPTTYGGGQEPIIHLESSVEKIESAGLSWFFTDRQAYIGYAKQYDDPSKLQELDWETLLSDRWNNTAEDSDRQERKMAECLVHSFVPWACITRIGVYSQRYKEDAESVGVHP